MKLLFNLDVIEGNRVRARPSEYLLSMPVEQQMRAVSEFLQWAEQEAQSNPDLKARAEAEIGIATAREYLDKLQHDTPRIHTGTGRRNDHE